MILHQHTGRWKLGAALAVSTTFLWGALPIALKITLQKMDGYTITWYRMLVASLVLFALLAARRRLPRLRTLKRSSWILMGIAVVGLGANYILYILGLDYTTPGNAQVVIQTAPIFVILGALFLFRERFSLLQWAGFATFVVGLGLFFHDQLRILIDQWREYLVGIALVFVAAVTWAAYALAQKQLLRDLGAAGIMLSIYVVCAVAFLPLARPAALLDLGPLHFGTLAFASVNTLLAYGAFSTSLDHWEASRISALLAVTPLLTLGFMEVTTHFWPAVIAPERMTPIGVVGALLVVGGSAAAAVGKGRA